ncbi:MAG: elongation factor G [Kiritimatiellae bacterium]|nr:elongation factor G [Kiritimatiellia bacterium]
MSVVPVANVRNFVILGHSGSGKTALTDAFAFRLGLNDRLGLTSNGSSISDTTDEEKSRRITIFASTFSKNYTLGDQEYKLTFTDAPGFRDFYGQILGAVHAADFALITVDATARVQVGTRRAWHICKENDLSSIAFVITGLDKENADFEKTVAAIRDNFGVSCVPVTAPVSKEEVINIMDQAELPPNLANIHTSLAESAAETSEELMNKYFEEGTLEPAEIRAGLLKGIQAGEIHPIYAAFPLSGVGIDPLLQSICRLLPAPGHRPQKDSEGNVILADPNGPFIGQVWRTAIDIFMGQLSFVRVVSGTLKPGMTVLNTTTDTKESIPAMMLLIGKKQIPVESAGPGDIVAIPKLKKTKTNHTLVGDGSATRMAEIQFPPPVTFVAIKAKTQNDEDKMSDGIHRLLNEDPTIQYEKQIETKEVLLKGLGDVHIDVAVALLKQQSNVNVNTFTPKVPYHETITGKGEGHHKHKKQSGGRGQFGEVYIRIEPLLEGDDEYFCNETVGGSIPGSFIPGVKKGIDEGMLAGALAGYPVKNVKVRLYDGSYHDVDSSEVAFKIAGSRALKAAMLVAKPVLLEPIMRLKITSPEAFMGAISGDMPNKRGRLLGLEVNGDIQTITAEAPLAELFKYSAELRSITGGQGSFVMDFIRYDIVPANIAQKIIAEADKHRKSDED